MKTNSLLLMLGLVLVSVAAACGSEHAVSLGRPVAQTTPTGTTKTHFSHTGWVIWLARGDGLVPSLHTTTTATIAPARAAIEELLRGPNRNDRAAGLSTAIPKGTKLLGISLHHKIATIDLTSEYATGGGSTSVLYRLGQVVYTLTEFPTIKKVLFHLDGAPVHVFSSHGVVLDHAVGRADYVDLLPPITVTSPVSGERVSSPVTVSGEANVFEANVSIEVLDANGKVVGKTFTTATCGTGCRGTYSTHVTYSVTHEQRGTIVVHDDDAAGTGTPPHSVRIPVTLTP